MEQHVRRSRTISFRLSAEEYDELTECIEERGLQSLSQLTRRALHHYVKQNDVSQDGRLTTKVDDLDQRLGELAEKVEHLYQMQPRAMASTAEDQAS